MSAVDQVIAQSFLRNQQGLETLPQRFQAGQDAAQMRTMQSQLRQGIDSGASMLEQAPLFAKMATIDPQAAGQMQSLFATLNKNQVVDMFASVPIALSMPYSKATDFWKNKKREFANNPNALSQIDSIINASPKERARIYGGALEMGQSMGVLQKSRGTQSSAVRETEWFGKQSPEVQETHLKLKRGEKMTTEEKMMYDRAKSDLAVQETAQKEDIKLGAKELNLLAKESRGASKQLNTIDRLESLNEKAFSGSAAGFRLEVAKLLKPIIDIKGLSETEQFRAISNELVLDKSQQMTGALSNADMIFLQNTAPTISDTKEGRGQIIDFARKLAERQKEHAKQAQEFKKDNGYFNLSEFQSQFDSWANENPLFPGSNEMAAVAEQQSQSTVLSRAEAAELAELEAWASQQGGQ
jgi:hypothetical protein